MKLLLFSEFVILFNACVASKIALFMLELSDSQVLLNSRVADVLSKAGHNVTIIMIRELNNTRRIVKIGEKINVYTVHSEIGRTMEEAKRSEMISAFEDLSMNDPRGQKVMQEMSEMLVGGCKNTITNATFMKWIREAKFDMAFSHEYDYCSIGIIHYAKIPTWSWLVSGAIMEHVAWASGTPIVPSYSPPMPMDAGAVMHFIERMKSFIGHGLMKVIFPRLWVADQMTLFREHISPDFPDLYELSKTAALVFVNDNELLSQARPIIHKVIYIGGVGMHFTDAKPLPEEFHTIVNGGKKVILCSFGSVTNTTFMPQYWKDTLLSSFAQFPKFEFIFRYEGEDLFSVAPNNVHIHKWIPQSDLLKNPNIVGFITHGGYNGIQESVISGTPVLTIPLFGDQPKNGKIAEQIGFGVNLRKAGISVDNLVTSLRKLIDNPKPTATVRRLAKMLRKQPISGEERLVKWTNFILDFQKVEQLDPYGQQLDFITYHSLDVIAFLSLVVVCVILVIYKILVGLISIIKRTMFTKTKIE